LIYEGDNYSDAGGFEEQIGEGTAEAGSKGYLYATTDRFAISGRRSL
jgi:hypothetical protein